MSGIRARNDVLLPLGILGTLSRKLLGYHRRSWVEATVNYIKQLCQHLIARTFDRRVAKGRIWVGILNRFTVLGMPMAVFVA